jgi:hypothetical protein
MKKLLVLFLLIPSICFGGTFYSTGSPDELYILETGGTRIDPATEGKQDDIITELQTNKFYDTGNSRDTILTNGQVFTGNWIDTTGYVQAIIDVNTDEDAASGGMRFEYSTDGINVDHAHTFTPLANDPDGHHYATTLDSQYFRVKYTNGGVTQGAFSLSTTLFKNAPEEGHVHPVNYVIDDDHQASIVRAVLVAKNPGGDYDNINRTTGGNLKISLEEFDDAVKGIEPQADAMAVTLATDHYDESTRAVNTVDYSHHEIHEGSTYEYKEVVDLAINNVRDIQITTPNTTKWGHFTFRFTTESETEWHLYENVTINTPGTSYTPINSNRNSANTSDLTVAYIDNTSAANANADTAVAGATQILHGISGAGRDSGLYSHEHEIILKQNEDYTVRFDASAAGFVDYHLDWYEHTASSN